MFIALKRKAAGLSKRISEGLLALADIAGGLLAGSGAAVVAFLGKFMLAVVLGAIALGFFLRLASRRGVPPVSPARMGLRYQLASACLAVVQVAALTEASNLPVRFDQNGFEPWHWVLVLVALAVGYSLNMWLFRALFGKRRVAPQLPETQ
jgi:hypothetical protein